MANNGGPGPGPLAGNVVRFDIRFAGDTQLIHNAPPEVSSELHVKITVNFITHHGDTQTSEVTLYFQLDILSVSPAEERASLAELFTDIGFTSPLGSDPVIDRIIAFCSRTISRVPPSGQIAHMRAEVDVLVSYIIPDPIERDFVPRVGPASEEDIEQLERVKITDEAAAANATCTICLDKVSPGSEAIRLPCSHEFHENCIVNWLKISKICPLCRSGIV